MLNVFRFISGAIYGGVTAYSALLDGVYSTLVKGALGRVIDERGIEAIDNFVERRIEAAADFIERYAPEWLHVAVSWLMKARADYDAAVDNGVDAARAFIGRLRRG